MQPILLSISSTGIFGANVIRRCLRSQKAVKFVCLTFRCYNLITIFFSFLLNPPTLYSLSNSWPLFHLLLLHPYMHIQTYLLKYNLLSHIMLLVCTFSGLFGTRQPIGALFPGEGHLSCSQLFSVAWSPLYGIEGSWYCPHRLCIVHRCHPRPVHI